MPVKFDSKSKEMLRLQNYINGQLCTPISKEYIDNYEPSTAEVYAQIPNSNKEDVEQAVAAAEAAFPVWSTTPVEKRAAILTKISNLILENLDTLAEAESRDNGKPVRLAKQVDIPRAAKNFHFYGTAILHFGSEAHAMANRAINYTLRDPLGVVACIAPWNLPLYLLSWKIAPALAAGNSVIAKPSELSPMTAYLLSQLCIEAGLPAGVLNIVHGWGPSAGAALVTHPKIKAVSFTGGTKTGATIARLAAPNFKKLSLELGGKNPNIIFADCNYDKMLKTTVHSSFANQGQICLCGSRIFVERPLYEQFKKDFVYKAAQLKIGNPKEADTKVGAVISKSHREKILSYIEGAKEEGGTILLGGKAARVAGACSHGYFVQPTIIEGLAPDCRINQEEVFGPLVTLMPFDTEEEVLKYANSVRYGLSATVWTSNLNRATQFSQKLESGIVWVNCWLLRDLRTPFGGIKDSGVGREGGFEALRFFTEPKNICIEY